MIINMDKELGKTFDDLQNDIVKKASIYKDTEFDPFYRFVIGEMNWSECAKEISNNIIKENVFLVWELDEWDGWRYNLILVTMEEQEAKDASGKDSPHDPREETGIRWYEIRRLGEEE